LDTASQVRFTDALRTATRLGQHFSFWFGEVTELGCQDADLCECRQVAHAGLNLSEVKDRSRGERDSQERPLTGNALNFQ
jgi:hypothetical protein